jgi:hypothetical protein
MGPSIGIYKPVYAEITVIRFISKITAVGVILRSILCAGFYPVILPFPDKSPGKPFVAIYKIPIIL